MTYSLPKLFPHFSHRIPSRLVFGLETMFLWLSLTTLITVNIIVSQRSRPSYWNELMKLFSTPFSVSRHMDLASTLWQHGQKPEARELMLSAQSLFPTIQARAQRNTVHVLGSITTPMDTLTQWEQETNQLKSRYAFWQTVVISKPDYRDAFVTLAVLAHQLRNASEAKSWLSQAHALDPNDPTTQKLAQFFQGVQ